ARQWDLGKVFFLESMEAVFRTRGHPGHKQSQYARREKDQKVLKRPFFASDLIDATARAAAFPIDSDDRYSRNVNDQQLASLIPLRLKRIDRSPPNLSILRFCARLERVLLAIQVPAKARISCQRHGLAGAVKDIDDLGS